MPATQVTANTSGASLFTIVSGAGLKGQLEGLKIDNQAAVPEKIQLYDCFTTDPSNTMAAGAAQAAEDFFAAVLSGKVRLQVTVPAGEFISFGKEDLKEVTFLGKAYVVGGSTSSDCVVIAQYALK